MMMLEEKLLIDSFLNYININNLWMLAMVVSFLNLNMKIIMLEISFVG
jgi:hypothetical protein